MKKTIFTILSLVLLAASCGKSDIIAPVGSKTAPAQVTVDSVVNFAGGATIYYKLPDDSNLKYVKAVYTPRMGTKAETRASYYTNYLSVEGFDKSGDATVELYSVSYGEAASEPLSVKICPDEPGYLTAFNSLTVSSTFGGVYVDFENPCSDNLAIAVRKKNDQGKWEDIYTQYTSASSGKFSVRGQESVPTEFGFEVKDRWGNTSELLDSTMTPLFESLCDKNKFKKLTLAGDTYLCHTWANADSKLNDMTYIWNGILEDVPCFQTETSASMPQHFTFDMGAEYKLSRFVLWTRNTTSNLYKAGHIRKFAVYGSNGYNPDGTLFNAEGELDPSWFLIGEYESFRPSGSESAADSSNPLTTEDQAVLENGEEYLVDEEVPAARYIRIRTTETWGKVVYIHLGELSFYGQSIDAE